MIDLAAELKRLEDLVYGRDGFLEHCGPEGTGWSHGRMRWNCMTCSGEYIGGRDDMDKIRHAETCAYVRASASRRTQGGGDGE